jgi:uncharacterized membrane protein YgcG
MKVFPWIPAVLVPALVACSSQLPPPLPATFVRPLRVAFACFDTATKKVLHLDDCKPTFNQDGTVATTTRALHALVTQSDRGEVAAVDLNAMRVIDSRGDIPGFTFVPAGELPGPIVVPPNHPEHTYVANSGSRDISVLQTSAFRELMVGQNATQQRVPVQIDEAQGAATPFDMLLSPDQDALFVTAPAAGWLLRMPIQRCPEGADDTCREGEIDREHIVVVPLDASLPQAQPMEPPMGPEVEPYSRICNPELLLPVPMASTSKIPSDVTSSAPQPQPAGMALDAFCTPGEGECKRRLLVADKRLPIVHVVDLDVLAAGNARDSVLPPIVTGVATERVAVTPRVPVDVNESDRETQYVYAIDATDGSVLVTRDGRVLDVASDPTGRPDRLDLGRSRGGTVVATGRTDNGSLVALSLGVLTPGFDVTAPSAQQWVQPNNSADKSLPMCTDALYPTRTADRLRGVFLAVGLTDGTVRIVDVHDMELANCRDSCDATPTDPYPVLRNRPRIRVAYIPTVGVATPVIIPAVAPQFEIDNDVIAVNSDGTTNDPRVAGLDCLTCPANEGVSFPATGVVVSADGGVDTGDVAAGSGGISGGVAGAGGAGAGSGGGGGGGGGGAAGGAGGVGDAGSRDAGAQAGGAAPIANRACGAAQGRVCSLADPWIDPVHWLAIYEGAIPGTNGGHGRFVDTTSGDNLTGSLEFQGEALFCGAGVLGGEDIGDGHEGDQIQITSEFPAAQFADQVRQHPDLAELRDDCEILVRARDVEKTAIAFRIKQAYADRLVIEDTLIERPRDLKRSRADYAFVQQCFLDMLLSFEVHVSKSYTVLSQTAASFRHRVVADPTSNRCVVNQELDPRRTSRAYEGVVFDNGFVSFKTSAKAPPEPLTRLRLLSGSTVPKLILDASSLSGATVYGVLPVELKYSDIDQHLYVVDVTARGLIPVPLAPFPSAVLSSYQ